MKINVTERGVTLLITLLLMGVLLGVGASLLSITLKQYQLAGIAYSSEMAFQSATAGMECALYHDFPKSGVSPFDVGETVGDMTCMGVSDAVAGAVGTITSGEEQRYQFSWGAPEVCSEVSIYKYFSDSANVNYTINGTNKSCPQNSSCTVVKARGYNVSCGAVNAGTNPRVVEREYTQVY
ncbi:MAG: hypothetical protein NUW00_03905 [Candidatus Kaiserbacteria bacterium]|nr:hypothetical protein [Candidatus Kaiserbacteria bacterium]